MKSTRGASVFRKSPLTSRLLALAAAASMVVATVSGVMLAPVASADPGPVVQKTAEGVTADALPTVQIDGVAWTQLVVGNTVYVGGQFANARPAGAAPGTNLTPRANVLAYNLTTGALISTFTANTNAQVYSLAISPDKSRLYIGGSFTTIGGVAKSRIAAVDPNSGALISTFAAKTDSAVKAIVATGTTVYVGGVFNNANNIPRSRLAAFAATNGALTTWDPSADATVNALVMSPKDAKLIAGGEFQNVHGASAYGLAAISATDGALLPWNATKTVRNAGSSASILSLYTDGASIFGSGYVFGAGGNLEGAFSADPITGDINYLEDCHGDTYGVYANSAAMYTVSHDHYCGNIGGFPQSDPWATNMRRALAYTPYANGTAAHDPYGYYDFYGTPTPSLINWFPDLQAGTYTGKTQAAWTVAGNDSYVVLGGEFPTVNGTAQQGLVRFAVKSIAPKKSGPQYVGSRTNPTVTGIQAGARVAWQANSDRDDKTLTYTVTRNGTQVYQTTMDSVFWSRPTMGFIDTNLTAGTLYKYRLTITDPDGNSAQSDIINYTAPAGGSTNAYAARVNADGASPYWPMNETSGSVLIDNTGFNDADVTAGVTRGASGAIAGNAATTFSGSDFAATRTAITGPDVYTTTAWIRTTTTSGGKILGFGCNNTGNSGCYDRHTYMDNAGHIWYGVYPNGVATLNSSGTYNDGQWHMIVTSLGPDGMKLYIDDKLIGQRSDVTWGQGYQGYWRVGGDNLGGWPNQPSSNNFAGDIDEVAIYPTVLSRSAVDAQWVASGRTSNIPTAPADAYGKAVFNDNPLLFWRLGETSGTTAADSGPNGDQTGVYENGVTQGATGGIKGTTDTAASFDGNDDVVASSNSYNNPKNYSEEAWFKTTSTNGGKIIGFGSNQNGNSGGYDRHVYMNNDGTIHFGVWTGQTNTVDPSTHYNDGQWHHLVATQSTSTGLALYVDGALVGTNPQTDAQDYTGYWRVGGDNHWGCCSAYLNATIDDVAIYSSVLTASQVANHFNLGSTVAVANNPPTAAFTSTPGVLHADFDASGSTDSDGTIASYSWDFGDNTAAGTGKTPGHDYAAAGTYQVSLTVTDNGGATSTTVTHPVTVSAPPNQKPTAAFSVTKTNLQASVDANASADPDGTIASYSWDFGDNTAAGTGKTTNHTYTAGGTYTITLTVTDNQGATDTVTHSVTVTPANQAPTASFVASAMQLTGSFDGTASKDADGSIASYSWNFGDNTAAGTGVTTSHAYGAAGTYTITLTVTDNLGAVGTSTQQLQVTAPPPNNPPVSNFTVTKNGLTVNLESTSTDSDGQITGYAWDYGDQTAAGTDSAVVHTYAASGTYPVKLTVTDNSGAQASKTVTVTVTAPPPANVPPTAAYSFTTTGLKVDLNAAGSTDSDGTIAGYSWDFGDNSNDNTTSATDSHTYAAAGTYQVKLTVTDNSGATDSMTKSVTVNSAAPTPLVNDTFGRTVASGFGSADVGGAWTITGGNTNFSVGSGTGKIKMAAAGSGPSATLGAPSSADVDLTIDMSLDKAPTGGGVYVTTAVRKVGTSEYRVTTKFLAGGSVQQQILKVVNGTSTSLATATVAGLSYVAGDTVSVRFQVSGSTSVALKSKIWKTAGTEPAAWSASATDASSTLSSTGGVALYPYLTGSATAVPVVATFDNLQVFGVAP